MHSNGNNTVLFTITCTTTLLYSFTYLVIKSLLNSVCNTVYCTSLMCPLPYQHLTVNLFSTVSSFFVSPMARFKGQVIRILTNLSKGTEDHWEVGGGGKGCI